MKKLDVPVGSETEQRSKATIEESYDTEFLFTRVIYLLNIGS